MTVRRGVCSQNVMSLHQKKSRFSIIHIGMVLKKHPQQNYYRLRTLRDIYKPVMCKVYSTFAERSKKKFVRPYREDSWV